MIQHQPVPDWGERIDYQFTVQPGGIDTVWINMVYNCPSSERAHFHLLPFPILSTLLKSASKTPIVAALGS
jgi:hypothetical protein